MTFGALVCATAVAVLCTTTDVAAQQRDTTRRALPADTSRARDLVEQRLGRSVSNEEMLELLQRSGLSRAQIRSRLQQMGFDPGLADEYFDLIDSGDVAPRGNVPRDFLTALNAIGVATPGLPDLMRDTLLMADSLYADSMALDSLRRDRDRRKIEVFGLDFFERAPRDFEAVTYGPIDAGYRLGPGDELSLVITGDVESAYQLEVTREGLIFIPDVGQISVNGLTLAQLEQVLFNRLGRVYSGIARGAEATTHFSVSIGRLRMNQVYITGQVFRPGAYQVTAAATVFNALYRAGGPTEDGTFRTVQVSRPGSEPQVVDLYDYLIYGDGRSDVRIEHSDRVFVPPAGPQVRVEGSVKRPAIYELRGEEGVRAVLAFAGGLEPDAVVSRIQIDRILPPGERQPGLVRVLRDVDLGALFQGTSEVPLQDGDVISIFAVSSEVRNRIWLTGEVRQPGVYEWMPGTTLQSVLERADGVTERAYAPRVHVYRLNQEDNTRRLLRLPLEAGAPTAGQFSLMDADSVVVLSREELTNEQAVSIEGFVKLPGQYALAEGMTLKDLILAAGGFTHGAYSLEAEVSRLPNPLERTDTTARIIRMALDAADEAFAPAGENGNRVPLWAPDSAEFELRHGDRVFVRKAPGYDVPRQVAILGQVMLPGAYVLETRGERLSDLLQRAGGLTPQAYPAGMHVLRDGRIVAADLHRAIQNPGDRNNILLEAGDTIRVPAFDPMVKISGEVNFEAQVLHRPGAGVGYYINQAGGFTDGADKGRLTVTYQNGERSGMRGFLFFDRAPNVQPGSTIFVPAKPEDEGGFDWDAFLTRTLTVLSTAATVIIAVSQLNN